MCRVYLNIIHQLSPAHVHSRHSPHVIAHAIHHIPMYTLYNQHAGKKERERERERESEREKTLFCVKYM